MRVDDLLRRIIVFVGFETEAGGFVPYGTGFLCRHDFHSSGLGTTFIATAKHVFDLVPGAAISVRINRKDGASGTIRLQKDCFQLRPPDPTVDLIMLSTSLDSTVYEFLALPLNREIAEQQKRNFKITPKIGDEVCVSGLYTSHFGSVRNIPIVRIGHIAAMPEEPVRTDVGYLDGYLIELHSIAGLSGSPVFVTVPPLRINERGQAEYLTEEVHIPLGMLIGHHVIETKEDEILVRPDFTPDSFHEPSALTEKNTGFGVVVPIERLYEAVEAPGYQAAVAEVLIREHLSSGFNPEIPKGTGG